jgi:hypothetical protein
MKRTTLSTALYVSLVFLSGGVVGGFAHRLYMVNSASASVPKPDEWRRKNVEEMRERVHLNDQQITQLTTILDTTRNRFHAVKAKWDREAKKLRQPEMKAIQEDQIRQINEILSEQQRAEYQKLREDRDKRRQQQNNNAKPPVPSGD